MQIDAHQHFWHYDPKQLAWIEKGMALLKRDFLPQDLEPILAKNGVDGSVVVQARHDLEETRWLLSLAEEHGFIKGVVGWVNLRSATVDAQLEEFCAHPAFKGVRHVVHDEPDDEFLLGDAFKLGIAALAPRGLTYDILIYPKHLSIATRFVDLFPDQRFVLDHLAKPYIKRDELEPWASELRELALRDNVSVKISGLVTEANWTEWKITEFVKYLDVVLEAFGHSRMMFGSDWPVCLLASEYATMKDIVDVYATWLSDHERARVFGDNAVQFYNLDT